MIGFEYLFYSYLSNYHLLQELGRLMLSTYVAKKFADLVFASKMGVELLAFISYYSIYVFQILSSKFDWWDCPDIDSCLNRPWFPNALSRILHPRCFANYYLVMSVLCLMFSENCLLGFNLQYWQLFHAWSVSWPATNSVRVFFRGRGLFPATAFVIASFSFHIASCAKAPSA